MFLLHMASSVWQTHQAMDGTGRAKCENCCSRTGDHIFYQIGGTVNDGNLNLSIEMRRSQTWTCRHGTPIHPTFPPGAATLQARRLRDTILCRSCSQNDQSRCLVRYLLYTRRLLMLVATSRHLSSTCPAFGSSWQSDICFSLLPAWRYPS